MSRPKSLKPSYCLHCASGRPYVTIDGGRVYLGVHGTQESRDKYDRVIGEWIARGRQSKPKETIMANPLKLLKLKPKGFQFIKELPIQASPEKVWSSLINVVIHAAGVSTRAGLRLGKDENPKR